MAIIKFDTIDTLKDVTPSVFKNRDCRKPIFNASDRVCTSRRTSSSSKSFIGSEKYFYEVCREFDKELIFAWIKEKFPTEVRIHGTTADSNFLFFWNNFFTDYAKECWRTHLEQFKISYDQEIERKKRYKEFQLKYNRSCEDAEEEVYEPTPEVEIFGTLGSMYDWDKYQF